MMTKSLILVAIQAFTVSSTIQRSLDEAAVQEAAFKQDHHTFLETAEHPKSQRKVKELKAALAAGHARREDRARSQDDDDDHRRSKVDMEDHDYDYKHDNDVPLRRNLRSNAKDDAKEAHGDVAEMKWQTVLDAAGWNPKKNSEEDSMEKQLTDLMMAGGGLQGTPFGNSVEQITKLIEDDMMVKVKKAHKDNQEQLEKEVTEIKECGSTKASQVAEANVKKAEYLKTSPMHKTCRAGEEGKFTEKEENYKEMNDKANIKRLKCKEFASVSKKVTDQQANGQVVKRGGDEPAESYVTRITQTFCGHYPPGGLGGGGKDGFLDIFMRAKHECQQATKEYEKQVKQYEAAKQEYEEKRAQCDSLQDQMDGAACKRATEMKDACESYAECYMGKKKTHESTVKMVKQEEVDRKAEWKGLKRMQCLMKAFKDGQVSNREVRRCKDKTHDISHLIIDYPAVPALTTCSVPKLYPSTPEYKKAEFSMLPTLAKGKDEENECTGIVEINTQPAKGSPKACKCDRMTLNGPYSAGPLVKCSNCIPTRRSVDKNSCPEGTKLFSPRSALDWKTIISSVGELRAPDFIVDVTAEKSSCGFCRKAMNSKSQGRTWQTVDGSPWWLSNSVQAGGFKNGQPNCYLAIGPISSEDKITFKQDGCKFSSKSYYCQLKEQSLVPKEGSPSSCNCKPVVLTGSYSAGSLIKCSRCLDVSKSSQKNSCPVGTKLFSPASGGDWKTFLASAKPLRSPHFIIDVTRPQNGCGGCTRYPMNSGNSAQMTWTTADGSPWWLRSTKYSEPNGDYTANCYMDLWKPARSETNIMFNDGRCGYHADSYYCQPAKKKKKDEDH